MLYLMIKYKLRTFSLPGWRNLVDAVDLKSTGGKPSVPVRVRPRALIS